MSVQFTDKWEIYNGPVSECPICYETDKKEKVSHSYHYVNHVYHTRCLGNWISQSVEHSSPTSKCMKCQKPIQHGALREKVHQLINDVDIIEIQEEAKKVSITSTFIGLAVGTLHSLLKQDKSIEPLDLMACSGVLGCCMIGIQQARQRRLPETGVEGLKYVVTLAVGTVVTGIVATVVSHFI